jgi:hypothetical protein
MSKGNKIKWRNVDEDKLSKAVKNFNAKIVREMQKDTNIIEYLPERVSKAELRKQLQEGNRAEFNKTINTLKRFSKRGAEEIITNQAGISTTKWELKELSLQVAAINRERTNERKKAENVEVETHGKKMGYTRAQGDTSRLVNLQPKKFNFENITSYKEYDKMKESINKQADSDYRTKQNVNFKAQYMANVEEKLPSYAKQINGILENLSSEKMAEIYYRDEQADIKFVYEVKQHGEAAIGEIILNIWRRAASEVLYE